MRAWQGLGARISAASIVVLVLVVLVANWFAQSAAQQKMTQELESSAASVVARLKIGLLEPVWNLNIDQAKQLVELEFADAAVDAAEVVDASGSRLVGLQRAEDGSIVELVEVPAAAFMDRNGKIEREEEAIGEIRLWLSDRTIKAELAAAARADWIKFGSVGLTLVILLNLLLIRWVTSPLGQMSNLLGKMVALKPGEPLDEIRRDKNLLVGRYGKNSSEIGTLTRAMDRFVGLFGELKTTTDAAQRAGRGLTCASANLMLLDEGGRLVLLNDAFEGYLKRQRDVAQAFGIDGDAKEGQEFAAVLEEWLGHPLSELEGPRQLERELGSRHGHVDLSPVASDSFEIVGFVVQWHDQTEMLARQAMERRLAAELANAVGAARRGDLSERINTAGAAGVLGELAGEVNHLLDSFDEALRRIQELHDALADGELGFRLDAPDWQGVFASVRDNANTTINRLAEMVASLREAARAVANGSSEIRSGTDELSRRIEQQVASLEESAAAMRDMSQSVTNNEKNSSAASTQSGAANEAAKRGAEAIARMQARMQEIGKGSRRIMEIVQLIDDIAFQTNLLALNAAVEAARAGEMGRGFAVVASEVRALAKRSADNSKDIRALLSSSDGEVQQGIALAGELSKAIAEISEAVGKSATLARTIAEATSEQADGIRQIDTVISDLDGITQQNSAIAEETAAASASLDEQAASVLDLLSQFTLADDDRPAAVNDEEPEEDA
ncbi:MAG TPA: methyl-accepting chemotaxis protein [Arenimonas sp.]|nr:methyl-accepting chemotaxis protein [Arenimonas sp.]